VIGTKTAVPMASWLRVSLRPSVRLVVANIRKLFAIYVSRDIEYGDL
jgi:hypothetical protein